MSSLAGWQGTFADPDRVLQRMAEAMSGPLPAVQQHVGDGFAVTTVQPAVVGDTERIAHSPDHQVTLAFAGYLYAEGSEERKRPARHCLALYLQRGPSFADGLNGSFAIAIHDRARSELHLITDRLASRPVFYCQADRFLFAGEVKAILEFPGVSRKLNTDRLVEFLLRERVFCRETYYDHIKRTPEASVLTWDGTRVSAARHWRPPFGAEKCWDLQENARRARAAIHNATRRACSGFSTPGLMLSGGLDSRAIAITSAVAPHCVTLHTRASYEVQTARRVAEALGYNHEFVPVPANYPLALVTDGTLAGDGMHAFHHAQALYLAEVVRERGIGCLMAGSHLEILLSDRMLPHRELNVMGMKWKLPLLAPQAGFDPVEEILRGRPSADKTARRQLVGEERADAVFAHARPRITAWLSGFGADGAHPYVLHNFAYLSNWSSGTTYLNARAIDRIAAPSLPMYDTELIDLFFTIPPEQRNFHRLYACLFTQLDRRCRWIPYVGTGVPLSTSTLLEYAGSRLHRKVFRAAYGGVSRLWLGRDGRPEWSSWPRLHRAMRDHPDWHRYLKARAESPRLADLGVIPGDGIRRIVEDQLAGRRNSPKLIGVWITLEEWLSRYA